MEWNTNNTLQYMDYIICQICNVDECGNINISKENICAAKTKHKNVMEFYEWILYDTEENYEHKKIK